MKKTAIVLGGSGGLGKLLKASSDEFDWQLLSSKDVDVTDEKQVADFFQGQEATIVLNMAIVNYDAEVRHLNNNEVEHQVQVGILGATWIAKYAIQNMERLGEGRFIYVSSVLTKKLIKGTSIYSAIKAYNEQLIKVMAREVYKKNITVNALRLGYFDGGLTAKVPAKVLERAVTSLPTGRVGNGEELARGVSFLVNNGYTNGTILDINGGLT